jgi:uncharacterized membrane protein YjjB (DUF3815 family)
MVAIGSQAGLKTAPGTTNLEERADLVLSFAWVLQANGQSTDETLLAAEQLEHHFGLSGAIIARWGELQLQAETGGARVFSVLPADPTGVGMDRVAAAMRAIDGIGRGALGPSSAANEIRSISRLPPSPAWLFTLAAAAGAAALSVIFGVEHLSSVALIIVSAGLGAVLRRTVARYSTNTVLQPFCAALVAGIIGGLAVQFNLSTSLRLIAVCPCMILMPGPHVLNGVMDLVDARIHLGAARLVYAIAVIVAIVAGLLLGLAILGTSLPVDPPGNPVPLWLDVGAAGVAVAAYSVFYSTPRWMFAWPIVVGALGHTLRWIALTVFGANVGTGALIACLFVGVVIAPVARRFHMPFAAIGFAAVVSMIPGVYLFRMASGLVQLAGGSNTTLALLSGTISDGVLAAMIILAMSAGLIAPKFLIAHFERRLTRAASSG